MDHVPHTLHFHQVPLTVLDIYLLYAAGVVDHIPHTLHFRQVPLTVLNIYLLLGGVIIPFPSANSPCYFFTSPPPSPTYPSLDIYLLFTAGVIALVTSDIQLNQLPITTYTVTKANQNKALLCKIAVPGMKKPLLLPKHFFPRPCWYFTFMFTLCGARTSGLHC